MNILADASLPGLFQAFPEPFNLTLYHDTAEIAALLPKQDVLLCRANTKINQSLLSNHQLRYVATASSGTDHLDHQWLANENIQIIDAKGCNARSVADYMLSCIGYLDKKNLIQGRNVGIIGCGKVGALVRQRIQALGFSTAVFDPLQNMFDDLTHVDLLCIHAELHENPPYPSKNLINRAFLARLKPGCVLINAARGGIVNEEDILKTRYIYCTDVYLDEPRIDPRIIAHATLCTPHIAGHSMEAKYMAVEMISHALHRIAGYPQTTCAKPQMSAGEQFKENMTWQEIVLTIYNPVHETAQLKQATNVPVDFVNLRKNHQFRHDFSLYDHALKFD